VTKDSLVNSITCINVSYNRRCFNDGYHIGHHLKQNRHWTELPQDFVANRERYRAEGCVVFHGLDFFMVSVLLFLHRYDVLAKRFVRMGDDTRTDAAIIEFLKSRTLRFVPSRGLAVQLAALSTALGLLSSTAWAGAPSSSLLAGAVPTRQEGLVRAAAMTDGHRPPEGAFWDSEVTAVLAPSGVVEWDLGEPRAVAAALLQADNNDTYVLSASLDGATWAPLWSAPPRDEPGLQTRTERALNLMVRYVRLTAEGGDGLYSIGEIQLFSNAGELPSVAPTVRRTTPVVTGRDPTALILLAVFGGILVFIHRQGTATPRARGTAEP
jgi:hypothetical protein